MSVAFERRALGYRGEELTLLVQAKGRWMGRTKEGWSARMVCVTDAAATVAHMIVAIAVPFVAMLSSLWLGARLGLVLTFLAFSMVVGLSTLTRAWLEKQKESVALAPRWREAQERRFVLNAEFPAEVRVVGEGDFCAVEMRLSEGHHRLASDLTRAEALLVVDELRRRGGEREISAEGVS